MQSHYDAAKQTYELTLSQRCKPAAGQKKPLPFHIPVAVGLLDAQGRDMALTLEGAASAKPSLHHLRAGADQGKTDFHFQPRHHQTHAIIAAQLLCAGGDGIQLYRPGAGTADGA